MRVLELFSGLGGWRYALQDRASVVAAYDVSEVANATYALNHGAWPVPKELGRIPQNEWSALRADAWLLSPPCQPFCRMGQHRGLEDRRSLAFLHLMAIFQEAPPELLVLENVPGFLGSDAHALLRQRLQAKGFHWFERTVCPSSFGVPNQRARVFVVASRKPVKALPMPVVPPCSLASLLDETEDEALYLRPETLARYHYGMDFVVAGDTRSTCFIGGYGRRLVGSGSFLRTAKGVRRFSPSEVARLLGLPATFRFPERVPLEGRYRLLGNGLSIPVATWVLDHVLNQ